MKRIFLLTASAVILLSCGTSKKKDDATQEASQKENTETTAKKETDSNILSSNEDLIVVLNNSNNITETKELIMNSGLKWEKLVFDQNSLKVGLIKVPAGKKDFWLDKLIESGAFNEVKLYSKKTLNELIEREKNKFISIKKSSCLGDCPSYEVFINNNGSVVFKGKKFVEKTGKHEFKLSDEEFNKLKEQLTAKDFTSFKHKYDNPEVQDAQSTFITFNNHQVQVKIWKDAPEELSKTNEFIEEILTKHKLIK